MPSVFETGGAKSRTLPEGSEVRGVVVEVSERNTRYGERAVLLLNVEGAPKGSKPVDYWLPRTMQHPTAGSRVRLMRTAARHYVMEVYAEGEKFPAKGAPGVLPLDTPDFEPSAPSA